MKELSEFKRYQIITVPDSSAVNCLYLNNALLHCSHEELPNSAKIFAYKIDYPRIELKNREFNRVNRYLTDRSLLFIKKRVYTVLFSNYSLNVNNIVNTQQAEQTASLKMNSDDNAVKKTDNENKYEVGQNEIVRI
jgi:hypothetical protein